MFEGRESLRFMFFHIDIQLFSFVSWKYFPWWFALVPLSQCNCAVPSVGLFLDFLGFPLIYIFFIIKQSQDVLINVFVIKLDLRWCKPSIFIFPQDFFVIYFTFPNKFWVSFYISTRKACCALHWLVFNLQFN